MKKARIPPGFLLPVFLPNSGRLSACRAHYLRVRMVSSTGLMIDNPLEHRLPYELLSVFGSECLHVAKIVHRIRIRQELNHQFRDIAAAKQIRCVLSECPESARLSDIKNGDLYVGQMVIVGISIVGQETPNMSEINAVGIMNDGELASMSAISPAGV